MQNIQKNQVVVTCDLLVGMGLTGEMADLYIQVMGHVLVDYINLAIYPQ